MPLVDVTLDDVCTKIELNGGETLRDVVALVAEQPYRINPHCLFAQQRLYQSKTESYLWKQITPDEPLQFTTDGNAIRLKTIMPIERTAKRNTNTNINTNSEMDYASLLLEVLVDEHTVVVLLYAPVKSEYLLELLNNNLTDYRDPFTEDELPLRSLDSLAKVDGYCGRFPELAKADIGIRSDGFAVTLVL